MSVSPASNSKTKARLVDCRHAKGPVDSMGFSMKTQFEALLKALK